MAAAPAAGAFLGALFSGWVSSVQRTGRAILIAVAGWGLAITAFGLVTVSFPLALVCLAFAGAADVFSAVFRSTLVQLETPDGLRGRVMSIHTLVVTSGPRLGDIEAAAVAALTTPQFAVVSGGILCLVGVGVVARRFPGADRLHPASAASRRVPRKFAGPWPRPVSRPSRIPGSAPCRRRRWQIAGLYAARSLGIDPKCA